MAPRTSWRGLLVALCVTIVLVTASCGDDPDDKATPVPTTTQPKTTTTTTEPATTEPGATETAETEPAETTDEEQLRQLTEDWYQQVRDINGGGEDPQSASTYLTGPYLRFILIDAKRRRDEGLVSRRDKTGTSSNMIEDIAITDGSATIVQCVVDADLLVRESDGEVLDDSIVAQRFSTMAQVTAEGWRLASRTNVAEWKGRTSCP